MTHCKVKKRLAVCAACFKSAPNELRSQRLRPVERGGRYEGLSDLVLGNEKRKGRRRRTRALGKRAVC